jgi:hypothetical protein
LASRGAVARISASTSSWQIGELFEQGGGHLFALLFFPHPDAVDLVDQPLPHIVDEKRFVVSNRLDDCSSLNFLSIGGRYSRSWVNSPSAGGDKRIAARSS